MVQTLQDLISFDKLRRGLALSFLLVLPYVAGHCLWREVLLGTENANLANGGTFGFFVIAPGIEDLLSADVAVFGILMVFSALARYYDRIPWIVVVIGIILLPVCLDLCAAVLLARSWWDSSWWPLSWVPAFPTTLWPYIHAMAGSTGAFVGLISTVTMLPFLAITYRVVEGRWPQYSLRQLLLVMMLLMCIALWSGDFMKVMQKGYARWGNEVHFAWDGRDVPEHIDGIAQFWR